MRSVDAPRRRTARAVGAIGCVLLPALAGCGSSSSANPQTPEEDAVTTTVSIDFDELDEINRERTEVESSGEVPVLAEMLAMDPSRVTTVELAPGDRALRLPVYARAGQQETAAVLAVTALSATSPHPLDPGRQSFTFGASFRLDEISRIKDRADFQAAPDLEKPDFDPDLDNGDNLLQRGNFADDGQYKIQIDARQPSCRIFGSGGEVFVEADVEVEANRWYDVSCHREVGEYGDDEVLLRLVEHRDDGGTEERTWSGTGPTGDLSGLPVTAPLAVGGKLTSDGLLVESDTDQFNGLVDDVFLDIDG